eukprot:c14076_g1_i1.p1 GENE.c14076_g1_i1~~c14076_g1_i1.p1  ORF type:complete len:335 (+),score=79.07 c14076_g1_i1:68-1006(+)
MLVAKGTVLAQLVCITIAFVVQQPGQALMQGTTAIPPLRVKHDVLIAVITAPNHMLARDAIRATWASEKSQQDNDFDVKFMIGELKPGQAGLEETLKQETDVVRLQGFQEDYYNLTAKALHTYTWAYEQGYKYIMKVDDDTFVNGPNFRAFMASHKNPNIYGGVLTRDSPTPKNEQSRWYLYDQYPHDTLPPYAIGAAILLGDRALKYISDHKDQLALYRIEDAAAGIWLQDLKLEMVSMGGEVYPYTPSNSAVFVNPVNHEEMFQLMDHRPDLHLKFCEENCFCYGAPNYNSECFNTFANNQYSDVVPRLL